MPALSLITLAQRAAARNVTAIDDVADLPYHVVEPILARIEDPAQLREIETNCEQIAEHSGPLWQAFIKRDVSNGAEKMIYPANPRSWHKVYSKMVRKEQHDKLVAEENLKKAMMGITDEKSDKKTVFVDRNLLSSGRPKQFADGVRNHTATASRPRDSVKEDAFGQIKRASAAQRQKVFKPKYTQANLPSAKSQIKVAPKGMMLDYQQPASAAALRAAAATARLREMAEPKSQTQRVFAPKTGLTKTERSIQEARYREQREREARLRAFTAPGEKTVAPAARPTTTPRTTSPSAAATGAPARPAATPQGRSLAAPLRTTASPHRSIAKPRLTSLPPSPPSTASPQKRPVNSSPAPAPAPALKRKRPSADPFMPAKKGRT